jgi:hypothetical protein
MASLLAAAAFPTYATERAFGKSAKPCPFSRVHALVAAGPAEGADEAFRNKRTIDATKADRSDTKAERSDTVFKQQTSASSSNPSGAAWPTSVQLTIRAKLHRVFAESLEVTNEAQISLPHSNPHYDNDANLPSAAKVVRLGFHDCMPYDDGTGGCDGCLEWTGVGERFATTSGIGNYSMTASDDGHNNGLGSTVELLEHIHTNGTFPSLAETLSQAPRDMGISRADLWAFAAMVAIEWSIDLNNRACAKNVMDSFSVHQQCHPRLGESDCEVQLPRAFLFSHGRRDCVPTGNWDAPYKTSKHEVHPDPNGNGATALSYMQTHFGFNSRGTSKAFLKASLQRAESRRFD